MAINIVIEDTVGVKVKGQILDAKGNPKPYDFMLICERKNSEELNAMLGGDITIGEVLNLVAKDWTGPRDAQGLPVPYSTEALAQICKIPGVAKKAFDSYLRSCGDVEKN